MSHITESKLRNHYTYTVTCKSKWQAVIKWELIPVYPDSFFIVHLTLNVNNHHWYWSNALLHCFTLLLSLISSTQVLVKFDTFGVRLPARKPEAPLDPVCGPPPPSWACWILKISRRFWVRISLLWISSTTRLGNQPLSPSWSLSPIIQPTTQDRGRSEEMWRWVLFMDLHLFGRFCEIMSDNNICHKSVMSKFKKLNKKLELLFMKKGICWYRSN